jgi:hypothetical protein
MVQDLTPPAALPQVTCKTCIHGEVHETFSRVERDEVRRCAWFNEFRNAVFVRRCEHHEPATPVRTVIL